MMHVGERKALYAFLARLFSYPDPELAAALAGGEGSEAARACGASPPPPITTIDLRQLEVAYTDLFLNRRGGIPAPLYGSVHLEPEGLLMGETSRQAAGFYRAEGLSLAGSGEPPDFLPTELEFLYYLVGQEEAALGRRDLLAAGAAVDRQRDFCRTLLHPWIPSFCQRLVEDPHAHPLYRWGADLLAAFCRQEADWLGALSAGS